jgi:hypothetical protein
MGPSVRPLLLAGLIAGLAMTVGQLWFAAPSADAQVVTKSATTAIEYRTVGTDFTALAATLTDLGNDGWQVEAIVHTDQIVETGGDGVTHLVARRMEVVASRPRSK